MDILEVNAIRPFVVRSWGAFAVRGALSVAFGIFAALRPAIALEALVFAFGIYAIADGALAFVTAVRLHAYGAWILGFEGVIGMLIGAGALRFPVQTAHLFVDVLSLWAVTTGALELALSWGFRHAPAVSGKLAIAGVSSLILGIVMLFWSSASALVLVMAIGLYAVGFGAANLAAAIHLRHLDADTTKFAMRAP